MTPKIEQLKKITSSHEWDSETQKLVDSLANDLDLAHAAENLRKHLVIQKIVTEFKWLIETISTNLSENEEISESLRRQMYADRRAYRKVVDIFSEDRVKQVNQQIDHLHEQASRQSSHAGRR